MQGYVLLSVSLYVFLLFLLSTIFLKKVVKSYEDYSLGGRSLTALFIFSTYLGTWIGGGTIIGLASWAYKSGVYRYWIFSIPYFFGFLFALLFLRRIRSLNRASLTDFFALRFPEFGEVIRIPVASAILFRNMTMIGMQFSALSYFIVYAFGIDRNFAILIIFIIITAYTSLGGLWGVVATDVVQGLLQTAGLLILFFVSAKFAGGLTAAYHFYDNIGEGYFINLISNHEWWDRIGTYLLPVGLFFLVGDQGDWQRIISSKTDKTAFWGYILPLTVALIWLLLPAYTGVFQRVGVPPEGDAEVVTFRFLFEYMKPSMGVFLFICVMAAIMSSADSFLLASGFTFTNDIFRIFINSKANDRELIFWNRFFVLIAGAFGFALAVIIENLIELWLVGIIVSNCILFVPYMAAWFSKRSTAIAVILAMAVSSIYSIAIIVTERYRFRLMWIGMALALIIITVTSMLTCRRAPRHERLFFMNRNRNS